MIDSELKQNVKWSDSIFMCAQPRFKKSMHFYWINNTSALTSAATQSAIAKCTWNPDALIVMFGFITLIFFLISES